MEQLSFTYVPAGTGIQPLGLEAVPADDGQLAAEGFGEMAAAVYDVLHEQLCREPVLHADETTLQMLKEPGRPSTSKSYMWL